MVTLRYRVGSGLVVLAMLVGCARTPPEQALREAMSRLQAATEQRDAATLQDLLADDFIGPDALDRDGARRMAQGLFMRYRNVGVRIGPLDITLQQPHAREPRASVRFDAVVAGGSGGLLPESGQIYAVETGWRMEDGQWRLLSAHWREKLGPQQ